MSISLANIETTFYDSYVKAAYQSAGHNLVSTVKSRIGFEGKFIQFPKTGELISVPTAYQDTVILQDPGHTKVTLIVTKYTTPAGTDELQEYTVNIDDRQENAMLAAMAVKRRQDQIIVDEALAASGTTNVIPNGGTNFTYNKFREVNEIFNENHVPRTDRYLLITPAVETFWLNIDKFVNNDYLKQAYVSTGTISGTMILGMKIIVFPDQTEGGLPLAGNILKCYAYHKNAIGFGMNRDFQTRIDYLPRLTTWQVNSIHQSGAIPIDIDGIVEIEVDLADLN